MLNKMFFSKLMEYNASTQEIKKVLYSNTTQQYKTHTDILPVVHSQCFNVLSCKNRGRHGL